MPLNNAEAASELEAMRKARDLTYAWIARRIGREGSAGTLWVQRKLKNKVMMTIDDYNTLLQAISSVTLLPELVN